MLQQALGLFLAGATLLQPAEVTPSPVLLELFTSLGCSSCPPADKLLAEIDGKQPVPGARLIVLSEHVDYWDNPRWSDPFSSASFTSRQQAYDKQFGAEEYTPQLVVNGRAALLGSDWSKAQGEIRTAMRAPHVPVQIAATRDGNKAKIDIAAGPYNDDKKLVVFLALARDRTSTHVSGGENAGNDLSEVAVAYSVKQMDKIEKQATYQKSFLVALPPDAKPGQLRAIVFFRKSNSTEVVGSAQATF